MNVRPLTLPDIPAVCAGAARIHALSLYAHMDYDPAVFAATLTTAVSHPERAFAEVIEHGGEPIGLLLAACPQSWFGKDRMAADALLYLLPEYWGKAGGSLKKIISRYEFWARGLGARVITLATTTGIQPEKTESFYERCGFAKVGSLHAIRVV